jgi:hypothetical protein
MNARDSDDMIVDRQTIDCWRTNYGLNKTPQELHAFWSAWAPPGAVVALRAAVGEIERLASALPLHEVGSAYAHRLAVMLECALLDPTGAWNDAHALLDEYRAACRAAAPMQEPPTFMGEPVVLAPAGMSFRTRADAT